MGLWIKRYILDQRNTSIIYPLLVAMVRARVNGVNMLYTVVKIYGAAKKFIWKQAGNVGRAVIKLRYSENPYIKQTERKSGGSKNYGPVFRRW